MSTGGFDSALGANIADETTPFPDNCGLFMQMSIVALCSIFLVARIGLSNRTKRELKIRRRRRQHTSGGDNAELDEFALIYRQPYSHKAEGSGQTVEDDD